jgi:hypothetical protein
MIDIANERIAGLFDNECHVSHLDVVVRSEFGFCAEEAHLLQTRLVDNKVLTSLTVREETYESCLEMIDPILYGIMRNTSLKTLELIFINGTPNWWSSTFNIFPVMLRRNQSLINLRLEGIHEENWVYIVRGLCENKTIQSLCIHFRPYNRKHWPNPTFCFRTWELLERNDTLQSLKFLIQINGWELPAVYTEYADHLRVNRGLRDVKLLYTDSCNNVKKYTTSMLERQLTMTKLLHNVSPVVDLSDRHWPFILATATHKRGLLYRLIKEKPDLFASAATKPILGLAGRVKQRSRKRTQGSVV